MMNIVWQRSLMIVLITVGRECSSLCVAAFLSPLSRVIVSIIIEQVGRYPTYTQLFRQSNFWSVKRRFGGFRAPLTRVS